MATQIPSPVPPVTSQIMPHFRSAQFLQQLETEIARRRDELDALIRAHDVLTGAATIATAAIAPAKQQQHQQHQQQPRPALTASSLAPPRTVADMVECILTDAGHDSAHVDQLLSELRTRYGVDITSKNLINTLNRWVTRGRRFKRTRPNTFALDILSSVAGDADHGADGGGSNGGSSPASNGGAGGGSNGGVTFATATTPHKSAGKRAAPRTRPATGRSTSRMSGGRSQRRKVA